MERLVDIFVRFDQQWVGLASALEKSAFMRFLAVVGHFAVVVGVVGGLWALWGHAQTVRRANLYSAWELLHSAHGQYASGARILALEDLVSAHETLDNVTLEGAELGGAKLKGVQMNGANLRKANLYQSNLSKGSFFLADFSGANLINVNMSQSNLLATDFSGAWVKGADFSGAMLAFSDLSNIREWKLASFQSANIYDVKASPEFIYWAKENGAISIRPDLADIFLERGLQLLVVDRHPELGEFPSSAEDRLNVLIKNIKIHQGS